MSGKVVDSDGEQQAISVENVPEVPLACEVAALRKRPRHHTVNCLYCVQRYSQYIMLMSAATPAMFDLFVP